MKAISLFAWGVRAGAIAALTVGCLLAASPSSAQEVRLNLVTAFPFEGKVGDKMYGIKLFIERFNERAAGKAHINVIGGPEVIEPFDHLKALQTGQFDMAVTSDLYFSELRDIQFKNFIPYDKQIELAKETIPLLQKITREKADVIYLQYSSPGLDFYVWSTKPIATLADAKGQKIRALGDLIWAMEQYLGVVPVRMPSHEVYSALRTGVVDGAIREWLSLEVLNEGEFLKYRMEPTLAWIESDTLISARAWDKLSPEVQQMMFDIARETEIECLEWMRERKKVNQRFLKETYGIETVPASDELKRVMEVEMPQAIIRSILKDSPYRAEIADAFKLQNVE